MKWCTNFSKCKTKGINLIMKIEKTITINIDNRVIFALHALLYFFAGFILFMMATSQYFGHSRSLINLLNFRTTIFGEKIIVHTGRIIYEFLYFLWTIFFFRKLFAGKKIQKIIKFIPLLLGIITFAMLTYLIVVSTITLIPNTFDISSEIFPAILSSIHALITGIIVMGIAVHLDNKQMKQLE